MIDYISFGQKKANNDEAILTAIVASIGIIMYISEASVFFSFSINTTMVYPYCQLK